MGAVDRTKLNLEIANLSTNQAADPETLEDVLIEVYDNLDKRPETTEVLTRTNATAFTPAAQFHPATKKYVDDGIAGAIIGNLPAGSLGYEQMNENVKTALYGGLIYAYKQFGGY